jgi:hypothetical protein
MAVTVGVAQQDVYPPRVLITVNGLTGGEVVQVYRVRAGQRTLLRTGYDVGGSSTAFLVLDAELPFGVPVSYVAKVDNTEYPAAGGTYVLPGGKVAISDAISDQAAEVIILAWPAKRYERDSSVFRASSGRTIVVSGPAGQYTSTVELFVSSTSSLNNLKALLDSATSNIVQIRQPGGYDGVDSYVSVVSWEERRFSQDGSDERRVVALTVSEVDPWDYSLAARGYTYQDLQDVYTGLTYNDLAGDYATYLLLAQAELEP